MSQGVLLPAKEYRLADESRWGGKRVLKMVAVTAIVVYCLATLFPFYVLFVRSFVSTKDSTDLHLWIPAGEEVSMDAEMGNLAVFYSLDLEKFKLDMGIPEDTYIAPRDTLQEVAEEFGIPTDRIKGYFGQFSTYNGWMVLLSGSDLLIALGRTFIISVVSLIGINVLSICTGYGLAGLRRKDQMFIYNLYLLQMVIPPMLIILPQFLIIKEMGLYNNFLSLILINLKGGALSTMIFTAFITAIPRDLEESAEIDGANRLQYVWHVLVPLLKVPMGTLSAIMLPQFWNQFLQPYVYLEKGNTTMLPMIQNYAGEFATNFQVIYTAVFTSILPLVLVYLIFRRFFVDGQLAGAIKG